MIDTLIAPLQDIIQRIDLLTQMLVSINTRLDRVERNVEFLVRDINNEVEDMQLSPISDSSSNSSNKLGCITSWCRKVDGNKN